MQGKSPSEMGTAASPDKVTFMVKKEVKQLLEAGKTHFDEGRIQEAIKHYKLALDADPSCALCHFNLGYAYHEDGQHDAARERYEKAVEMEPTCSLFLEHLARLHFETLEYQEAGRLFQRASMVGPIQPVSLGLWGRALFEQGHYEHSIDAFERLLRKKQRHEIQMGARYWMAVAHTKLGRIAAARKITEELLKYDEIDSKILYDLGENFIEARCLSLARAIFERLAVNREELLMARLRLEDIKSIESQIDEMLPKLFDGDEERTLHQIHALREFGNDRISKALVSLINTPSAPIRESVIRYQTSFGYNVASNILPLLADPVQYVREAAYDYFEKLDRGEFVQDLLPGLEDPQPDIRLKAIRFIGRFGAADVLPKLEMAVTDPRNRDCHRELRQAVNSVKRRFQKTQDEMSRVCIPDNSSPENNTPVKDWKFWMLLLLQTAFAGYFIYVVMFRL